MKMQRQAGGTVMTTAGHSITFVPGEETYVPDIPEVITACRAAGAVEVEVAAETAEAAKPAAKTKTAAKAE